jgi:hypothetical protein
MLTEKPKVQRTRVTAIDVDTGKSKTTTLYETSPEDVIAKIKSAAEPSPDQQQPAALAS